MIDNLKINAERKKMYYERGYWTSRTLTDAWDERVARSGDRPYVKDSYVDYATYSEIDDRASRLATWLHNQGVSNGDVVSFQIPKWIEFCVVYVACLKVGAVMHPIAVNFNEKDLEANLNKVGSSIYIGPTRYHAKDYERQFHAIGKLPAEFKAALFIDKDAPATIEGDASYYETIASSRPFCQPSPSKSDEAACILTTSGSTGAPKSALFTHNNILFSETAYLSVLDLTEDDVMWMPSPLNHATGFFHGLIAVMLLGGRTVLQQHYSPENAVELLNAEGCTWSHGATPFIYDMLHYLDETCTDLNTMRLYLCGGAPVPPSLIEQAHRYGILLCESYGSTESCPHVYVPPEKCLEWDGRWSGIAYDGIEVKVVDANRQEVERGTQGEEASRGPHQFVGYLGDPERTDKALDDEGWFYSGDLCTEDSEGRIRINGRIKEIIIRGGENLSANEIDANLNRCPGIGDHATIGMPDERMGERICTFAVAKEGRPSLEDITAYLESQNVPKRLWPERIEFIDRIPHTATGKVQRFKLAEELTRRMNSEAKVR